MYCPYCNQGEIVKAIIKSTNEVICICDECDTVWTSHEKISDKTGMNFSLYANAHNLEQLWTELELQSKF